MTTEERLIIENYGVSLLDQSTGHEDWLKVMQFGLATFAQNQPLLQELIFAEALREMKRHEGEWTAHEIAMQSQEICRELGLHLTPVPSPTIHLM